MPVRYRDFELSGDIISNVRDQLLLDAQDVYANQVERQVRAGLDAPLPAAPRRGSDVTVSSLSSYREQLLSEKFDLMRVLPRSKKDGALPQ